MSTPQFAIGQRWISDTEAELGLGIILEASNRRVTISFPAAAERRTYSADTAPISRVRYQIGDIIKNNDGISVTVSNIHEQDDYLIYIGHDEANNEVSLPEIELDSFVQFSTPQARLFSGQIDAPQRFMLRSQTLAHLRRTQQSPVIGLLGPRVQLLAHQLFIAHTVANRFAPRVLLADEVGLGKTIEAGLILHQQLISGRAQRALVVVPDSLVHQWLIEMIRRFNLHFTILNEARCANDTPALKDEFTEADEISNDEDIENPFESAQLVLCSLSFLTEQPARLVQARQGNWDLLLVDEAHHLHWDHENSSPEYECIESLAAVVPGLLLLTATPEQLGIESHFARLRLLDPDRYYDLEIFKEEETKYQPVNKLVQSLLKLLETGDQTSDYTLLLNELAVYLGPQSHKQLQQYFNEGKLNEAVEQATRELTDRHGTGRVLFRNTRLNVDGFPKRQLHTQGITAIDDLTAAFSTATTEEQLRPELLLIKTYGNKWPEFDARIHWVLKLLRQDQKEKFLLICSEAATALLLEEYLRTRGGISTAVFHEGLDLVARDRAAAYFADLEEGAQLLVCSEIGSEGRNFQFSHNLVLFDLPLNPDLLEQRIGRLDRIGQRNIVDIHVPYYKGSAAEVLLRWYHEGINSFSKTCAIGQILLERYSDRLNDCFSNSSDYEKLQKLLDDTAHDAEQLVSELQQGRDQLLEINSCNTNSANEIIDGIIADENRRELMQFMEKVFDEFGVEQDKHSANSIVLHPGDHMHCHHFPGLPEAGITATFNRETALSREDMHYLSWEHPMVVGAMDMIINGDFGNTTVNTLKLTSLTPGTLMLEIIFVVHCTAPKFLQISRYLPLTTIRCVVDAQGKDYNGILTSERLDSFIKNVPRRTAQKIIQHARADIEKLIASATNFAEQQQAEIVDEAITKMYGQQQIELQRLTELAKVNPNVRAAEIENIKLQTESLKDYLQHAQLKMDALRVLITVEK